MRVREQSDRLFGGVSEDGQEGLFRCRGNTYREVVGGGDFEGDGFRRVALCLARKGVVGKEKGEGYWCRLKEGRLSPSMDKVLNCEKMLELPPFTLNCLQRNTVY